MLRRASARLTLGAVAAVSVVLTAAPALADPSPAPLPSAAPAPGVPSPLPLPAATPGPVGDMSPVAVAQRQAAALQVKVAALRVQTEQAIEHYNEVQADYQAATKQHTVAQGALDAALATAQARDDAATDRIRALYMHGGTGGLAVAVVDGTNVTDVLSRYQGAQSVVEDDTAQVVRATVAAEAAQGAEQRLADAAARANQLRQQAATAAAAVKTQLGAAQSLLDSASAAVKSLVAAQLKAEREAAAKLATLLHNEQVRLRSKAVAFGVLPDRLQAQIAAMLLDAEAQVGKPYQWGATGPGSYDCSGFTQHAFAAAGVTLPRTSREQWYAGTHPDTAELVPGDLLFWASNTSDPTTIHHVAIYLGGGYMLSSPHTGALVSVQRVYAAGYLGATRVIAPPPVPAALTPAG